MRSHAAIGSRCPASSASTRSAYGARRATSSASRITTSFRLPMSVRFSHERRPTVRAVVAVREISENSRRPQSGAGSHDRCPGAPPVPHRPTAPARVRPAAPGAHPGFALFESLLSRHHPRSTRTTPAMSHASHVWPAPEPPRCRQPDRARLHLVDQPLRRLSARVTLRRTRAPATHPTGRPTHVTPQLTRRRLRTRQRTPPVHQTGSRRQGDMEALRNVRRCSSIVEPRPVGVQ